MNETTFRAQSWAVVDGRIVLEAASPDAQALEQELRASGAVVELLVRRKPAPIGEDATDPPPRKP